MQQIKMKNLLTMGGVFGIALAGLTLFSTLFSQDAAQANEPLNIEPRAANQITDTIQLDPAGSIDLDGAEIVAFDPDSDRFFVTSGDGLQIIDGSAAPELSLITVLTPSGEGFGSDEITSVAVSNGVVAAAVPAPTGTDPGFVLFYNVTGTLQSSVTVGALPDMLTFTPDGNRVLVAIEGQPEEADPSTIDPPGGIAVIDLSGGVLSPSVTILDFTAFTTGTDPDIRVFPGKTLAEDVEPEYITVSPDGNTAVATLQEANAIAVIDLTVPAIVDLVNLGTKDHSLAGNGFDASNRDSGINIQNWPVNGLYMPDAIASYEVGGTLYLVTANEGDARDPGDFGEALGDEARMGDFVLDPAVFGDVSELLLDENLGRLKSPNFDGVDPTLTGFKVEIDGDQANAGAGTGSEAEGVGQFVLNATEDTLSYTMRVEGLDFGTVATGISTTDSISDDVTSMHLHIGASGANGGIALGMISPEQDENFSITLNDDGSATLAGAWTGANVSSTISLADFVSNTQSITVGSEVDYYINIHTNAFGGGEIRGQLVKSDVQGTLYSYGARSFTIWNASTGAVVFDSGDAFEQELAANNPLYFNANDGSPEEFDARSDDKGPEPEGVTLGVVNSETYAFIGNERADGSIMVYNVTDPTSPQFVQRAGNVGSVAPEGLIFISAEDSPNGVPMLAVTYEVSNELVLYAITNPTENFKLQILHASDLEGGKEAIDDAKRFAAIVEGLELEAQFGGYESILLSAGDNYIPGPFYGAADSFDMRDPFQDIYGDYFGIPDSINDFREGAGRADITIMNIIGFDASALGNHEFDAGTAAIAGAIGPDVRDTNVRWAGALFPYLSANLDFSGDGELSGLYTSDILESSEFGVLPTSTALFTDTANAPKIAPATLVEAGGELIGVVGATTQLLESISSPGDTTVINGGSNDMAALAAILNPVITELISETDKIVLVSHLQQIALEKELAGLLNGVDVIIAGGSDTLQADSTDVLRPGDTAAEAYPFFTTNADSNPVAIVSTDGQYSYVGRLVIEFDTSGNILTDTVDADVSGAYATIDSQIIATWGMTETAYAEGTKGGTVEELTNALSGIVNAKDGIVYGMTDVFLEGRRSFVRTEETNLGTMSAQANLDAAQAYTGTGTLRSGEQMTGTMDVMVSIKNGGGIRAAIGEIVQEGETITYLPPQTNPESGKQTGQISQLDLENSFKFNNGLTIMTLTAQELRWVMEYGVAESGDGATPGQFPQVAGMRFSFDPAEQAIGISGTQVLTEGSRIRSLVIVDENGLAVDTVVRNGELSGDPAREIMIVTLDFLAGGGDGYPFEAFGENMIDTGIGEQQALADYLQENYPIAGTPYNIAETPAAEDVNIQDLTRVIRDTVIRQLFMPIAPRLNN